MKVEANDLLLFARVVEEGSFSRAAQRLSIPISTVSRRMTELENQLGERLLLRSTRKLTVTELGLALLEHARQVQQSAEAAASLAEHRKLEPSGRLRITMPTDLGLLAPCLAEFLAAYPAVVLELDVSTRFVDLIGESFDLALRLGELKDDSTLAARHIANLEAGLYASPAYLKLRGVPNEPTDLLKHFAIYAIRRTGEPLEWVLRRGKESWRGLPPPRATTNSPEMLMRLAVLGVGVILAEHRAVESYAQSAKLMRVLPDWDFPTFPLYAVFPGRRLMPARTRAFIEALATKFATAPTS